MKPIITGMLLLLFGATVPAFAQEEHHEESAKPAQHEEQAKPAAKQEQAKPQKQEQQAKPAKQEQAKPEKQQQQAKQKQAKAKPADQRTRSNRPRAINSSKRTTSTADQDSAEPTQQANGQAQQSHGPVRTNGQKDSPDTNTTRVNLVPTIMLALRQTVGATTTDDGSTLTAAIGSMQDRIQRGFTSRTCTSLWGQMGCGMQLHTVILL